MLLYRASQGGLNHTSNRVELDLRLEISSPLLYLLYLQNLK